MIAEVRVKQHIGFIHDDPFNILESHLRLADLPYPTPVSKVVGVDSFALTFPPVSTDEFEYGGRWCCEDVDGARLGRAAET